MTELQERYVPRVEDKFITVPCHADGTSVERMVEVHRQRSMELTPEDQLLGLQPTPQEFHHRGNVMKVNYQHNSAQQYIGLHKKRVHIRLGSSCPQCVHQIICYTTTTNWSICSLVQFQGLLLGVRIGDRKNINWCTSFLV